MTLHTIPCHCDIGGRVCGGELYHKVVAASENRDGWEVVTVTCGYCGQASLVSVHWQTVPVITEAVAMPQKGAGR